MDHFTDVLEVQHRDDDSVVIHPRSEQPELLTEEDLSLLTLRDIATAKDILEKYVKMDIPRENVQLFKTALIDRLDSWFVTVGDVGLIYLTNIVPSFQANFNVMFWDKRFGSDRRELVKRVLATAFSEFALTRVASFIPETNKPLAQVVLRKIGFTQEGVLRKGWRDNIDCDLIIFGLLREETKGWEPVLNLHTEVGEG